MHIFQTRFTRAVMRAIVLELLCEFSTSLNIHFQSRCDVDGDSRVFHRVLVVMLFAGEWTVLLRVYW